MALLKPNRNYQSCCLCILLSVHQSVSISYAQIYIKSLSCPIHFPCPKPEAVDRRTRITPRSRFEFHVPNSSHIFKVIAIPRIPKT